jgi:TfoX/Sxy family transcriptional regulator of competence genes
MSWRKSTDALKDLFLRTLPDDPRVERRSMFGYPCAFAGGSMFAGLHQENLIVRLGEVERAELLAKPPAKRAPAKKRA